MPAIAALRSERVLPVLLIAHTGAQEQSTAVQSGKRRQRIGAEELVAFGISLLEASQQSFVPGRGAGLVERDGLILRIGRAAYVLISVVVGGKKLMHGLLKHAIDT